MSKFMTGSVMMNGPNKVNLQKVCHLFLMLYYTLYCNWGSDRIQSHLQFPDF